MIHQVILCCSENGDSEWLKYLVPLIVPLIVAGLAGGFALLQVKTNIVSASRIKWIDDLRETLSEYLTELTKGLFYYRNHAVDMNNKGQTTNSEQNENYHKYTDSINIAHRLTLKIILFLDSKNNPLHRSLENEISDVNTLVVTLMEKDSPSVNEITQCSQDVNNKVSNILDASREIIAEEMKKTRRLFSRS